MLRTEDTEYECSLDEETLEKARRELGEKEETRLIEVDTLRKRLLKWPGLNARTDANFLLQFLRVRKFDQEKSFQSVKNFYSMKLKYPEIFDDLKPSRVKHIIDTGYVEVLKKRDKDGCQVVVLRGGTWDEKRYPLTEQLKTFALIVLQLQKEELNQVHGLHFILDLAGSHVGQMTHVTPNLIRLTVELTQNMVPLRLKRLDYVHLPQFFYKIFPLIKSLMKDKLVQRIYVNDASCQLLHSTIDPEHLPSDFCGKLEPHSDTTFLDKLMKSEKEYEDDNKQYGFVRMSLENEKKETSQEDASLQGLAGTFKKLDI